MSKEEKREKVAFIQEGDKKLIIIVNKEDESSQ